MAVAAKKTPKTRPKPEEPPPPTLWEQVRKHIPRMKPLHLTGFLIGFGLSVYGIYQLSQEPEIPPAVRLKRALRYLDDKYYPAARGIGQALREIGYQDPDFSGGVSFVLGMAAFREAEQTDLDWDTREQRYLTAVAELRDAERQSLIQSRRAEWAFGLGVSLHHVGSADEALPYLEEAVANYPEGKTAAALMLAEILLLTPSADETKQALALNNEVIKEAKLTPLQKDKAYLQQAQILMLLGKKEEAKRAMQQVSGATSAAHGSAILQAQTYIADGNFPEAMMKLEPVAAEKGLERIYASQACYLMGVCSERLAELEEKKIRELKSKVGVEPDLDELNKWNTAKVDKLENAVTYYKRTVEQFERTHEALAAKLGVAEAYRKLGRNEEALESYAAVLGTIRPSRFRNRWLSLKRVREIVLEAWNAWVEQRFYQEAIDLAELMSTASSSRASEARTGAIPLDEAHELIARANQRWAEHLEGEIAKLPADKQAARRDELKLRWKRAGAAYSRLAETRRTSTAYNDALWISAEDFLKGHDFINCVEQLTKFIDTRTTTLIPTALVRRGNALMDLGRFDEALRNFETTVTTYPTDPAAFQARYLIGQCHFERNDLDQAEKTWRRILESNDLTPNALEWRKSLYSLGKLLYFSADLALRRGQRLRSSNRAAEAQDLFATGYLRLDDAILRLEEYYRRYPTAAESQEVRFLLAKSLQKSAELPGEKLKSAETENARAQYRKQVIERLERALHEYQQLQTELAASQGSGKLDRVGRALMRNCYTDTAHCYFSLGQYEEAIIAYGNSAARYQQDSDSLTAYLQIANCYDRMQKPAEALSTLAQANLILKQLPDDAFPNNAGGMSREDWQRWLEWAMRLHK